MDSRRARPVGLLLLASLALAGLAQYDFANKRAFMWDGIVLYALAMLLFAQVIVRLENRPQSRQVSWWQGLWGEIWQALRYSKLRLGTLSAGALLVVYAALISVSRDASKPRWDLLGCWAAGNLLAVSAFIDWSGFPQRTRAAVSRLLPPSPEMVFVAVLVLLAWLLRAVDLRNIPYVLSGDEASMGLEAAGVLSGRLNNPFATGWFTHPTLYFFIQAIPLKLFGMTTAALRLSSALVSSLTTALLYIMARRFYGRWVAVVATLFYVTFHYAIHYGRLAINNIWDPFFALGIIYLLTQGLEERRLGRVVAAGMLTGLAVYFYTGARLIPITVAVYIAYWCWRQRGFLRGQLAYLLIYGGLALLVALPLLAFFRAHPREMMQRWTDLSIFASGWVKGQVAATGKSVATIVLEQFLKAVLAFNFYWDPVYWYMPGMPLLHFVPSVFFVIGITYAITQWRRREYMLLLVWFFLVIVFGGALLENPPSSMRLVLSIPPVAIFVALGIIKVSNAIRVALHRAQTTAVALSLALVLVIGYQSVQFYFGKYTPSHIFAGGNTEVADRIGRYLAALGPDYQCYLFGAPRIYFNFATIPFLANGVKGTDVPKPVVDRVDFVDRARKPVFVFVPERRNELDVVRRSYPSGSLREFRNKAGQILFVAYEADS